MAHLQLVLRRVETSEKGTFGKLYNGSELLCVTLEPPVRKPLVKIWGKTAIPSGIYQIQFLKSVKFGMLMPFLLGVPRFAGIMFHAGNTLEDTKGCILLGSVRNGNTISRSVVACKKITRLLLQFHSCEIIIIDAFKYTGSSTSRGLPIGLS